MCRGRKASWASPFTSKLAATTGRNVFVILRTGNSLSVALHLPSQERSYFQLMGPNQTHEGTCTLLFRRLRRRTSTVLRAVVRASYMRLRLASLVFAARRTALRTQDRTTYVHRTALRIPQRALHLDESPTKRLPFWVNPQSASGRG